MNTRAFLTLLATLALGFSFAQETRISWKTQLRDAPGKAYILVSNALDGKWDTIPYTPPSADTSAWRTTGGGKVNSPSAFAYRLGNTSIGTTANTHAFRADGLFQFNPTVSSRFDYQEGSGFAPMASYVIAMPGVVDGTGPGLFLASNAGAPLDRATLGRLYFGAENPNMVGVAYAGAYIEALADGNWASTALGTVLNFFTTSTTEAFARNTMTLQGDGRLELDRYFLFDDGLPGRLLGYDNTTKDITAHDIGGSPAPGAALVVNGAGTGVEWGAATGAGPSERVKFIDAGAANYSLPADTLSKYDRVLISSNALAGSRSITLPQLTAAFNGKIISIRGSTGPGQSITISATSESFYTYNCAYDGDFVVINANESMNGGDYGVYTYTVISANYERHCPLGGLSPTLSQASGSVDFSSKTGGVTKVDMDGLSSITISLSNAVNGGVYALHFINADDTDTVTWPAAFKYDDGSAVGADILSEGRRLVSFYFDGSNYYTQQ